MSADTTPCNIYFFMIKKNEKHISIAQLSVRWESILHLIKNHFVQP